MNWRGAAGLLLFMLASLLLSITMSGVGSDEAWSLQVVWRMQTGETLYRDIFCGVLPLSFYLTLALTKLLGAEVLIIKLSVALCMVLTVWTAGRVLQRLTGTQRYNWFLSCAVLLWGMPRATALYQPLATLFLLLCCHAALVWWQAEPESPQARSKLLAAGVWVGCCFATKQNMGVYALAASWLILALKHLSWPEQQTAIAPRAWSRFGRETFCVTLAGGLAVGLILLPVWWSGGLAKMIDYAFVNKRTYLRLGGISYFDGLREFGLALASPLAQGALRRIHGYLIFLLPLLTLGGLALVWRRLARAERKLIEMVGCFIGAALLALYPRADGMHLSYVVPILLVGLLAVWQRLQERWRAPCPAWFERVAALLMVGWVVLFLANSIRKLHSDQTAWVDLPHYRYTLLHRDDLVLKQAQTERLRAQMAGEPVLLLLGVAGFYYLATELKNPTPFDYPLATAFGTHGEADTIAALAQKRIRAVCLQRQAGQLAPVRLERYVIENLQREEDLGECTLYRVRP